MKPICTRHLLGCDCSPVIPVFNASERKLPQPRVDPSRTLRLQLSMISALSIKLDKLAVDVSAYWGKKPVRNAAFPFSSDEAKQKGFREWLDRKVKLGLYDTDQNGTPWTSTYINSAYKQGINRAYLQTNKKQIALTDSKIFEGGRRQFLKSAFDAPVRRETAEILATRTFDFIEGLGSRAKRKMNILLAEGLIDGEPMDVVAQRMVDEIKGMTLARAKTIARTEIAYAQGQGQLDAFEALGLDEVDIEAELVTAGDKKVCRRCWRLARNGPYTIKKARKLIPVHPNCRCAWSPVVI